MADKTLYPDLSADTEMDRFINSEGVTPSDILRHKVAAIRKTLYFNETFAIEVDKILTNLEFFKTKIHLRIINGKNPKRLLWRKKRYTNDEILKMVEVCALANWYIMQLNTEINDDHHYLHKTGKVSNKTLALAKQLKDEFKSVMENISHLVKYNFKWGVALSDWMVAETLSTIWGELEYVMQEKKLNYTTLTRME